MKNNYLLKMSCLILLISIILCGSVKADSISTYVKFDYQEISMHRSQTLFLRNYISFDHLSNCSAYSTGCEHALRDLKIYDADASGNITSSSTSNSCLSATFKKNDNNPYLVPVNTECYAFVRVFVYQYTYTVWLDWGWLILESGSTSDQLISPANGYYEFLVHVTPSGVGLENEDSSTDSAGATTDEEKACYGVFGNPTNPNTFAYFLQNTFNFIKFAGIMALIVTTIIDLFKTVSKQDKDDFKKLGSRSIKRIIYAVLIFFLPIIINFVFHLVGLYGTCGIS